MSKFIDAIGAKITNKRVLLPPEFAPLEVKSEYRELPCDDAYIWDVGVSWQFEAKIPKGSHDRVIAAIERNLMMELKEVVYGELRQKLLHAQRAVHSHDYTEALACLDAVVQEIY